MGTAKPEINTPDVQTQATAGHNALYWVISGGLLVAGVIATTISLLLPAGEDLLLPRVLSAVMGTLLVALSSAVLSYVLTRVVTVADVERRYTGVLDRIARSLAHVYARLQFATSQRRSGAYSHEETYQEVILSAASSLLAEFDSVTRLSGSITGAFKDSMRDLDEVRSIFVSDPLMAQTLTAARHENAPLAGELVSLACPSCGSRVTATLAMRAGWTSSVRCSNCGAKFNIHRRGDLTVYASHPKAVLAEQQGAEGTTGYEPTPEVPAVHAPINTKAAAGEPVDATCPECQSKFEIRFRQDQVRGDGTVKRVCTACGCRYSFDVASGVIADWTAGVVSKGTIVGRRASRVLVECPVDKFPLIASLPSKNGDWHALCASHQCVVAVTRQEMRDWLETNDPVFLAMRLNLEAEGGAKVLTD